jgi:uncharacterized protein (DUF1778 family)
VPFDTVAVRCGTTRLDKRTHATEAAREVLADRTLFVLPDDRWDAFVELLDRDERPMPGLAAFLARPSVFDPE